MDNEIEKIITEKKYTELSTEECAAISEFVANEAEYNDIKAMLLSLENAENYIEKIDPAENIKANLLQQYKSKYGRGKIPVLYRWLSAAAVLLVVATIWLFISKSQNADNNLAEKSSPVINSDRLQIQTDSGKNNETIPQHGTKDNLQTKQDIINNDKLLAENTKTETVQEEIASVKGISMAGNDDLMELTIVIF